ncbi:MAG: dihydrofolate reductase family protein [Thermaceae bacterium]|nr:dihydrofolate reductase family protein [Thermaceae bacterium]
MRKVVVTEFLSLDGVMEDPSWTFQFGSREQEQFKFDELKASDALLLGRVTYEGFAAAWPHMLEQTGEFGVMMNDYPKYVVSTTLKKLEWKNSHLLGGNLVEEIYKLKQQPGRDILVAGSAKLAQSLLEHGLVNEYRLLVFPIVLGSGKKLFANETDTKLKLVESKTFSSGVIALVYSS